MNFEKYSKQQFEGRGLDTSAARQLADELQDDVAEEIQGAVLAAFMKVVEGLNIQGHNLTPYGEIQVGDISFRDEPGEGLCNLRLACDVVISAGYSDTISADEIDAAT
jgi:hypothetical protein